MTKLFESEYGVSQFYRVTVTDEIVEKPHPNTTWELEGIDVPRLQRIVRAVASSDKAMRHVGAYLTLVEQLTSSCDEFDYFPGYYGKSSDDMSLVDIFKKVGFCFTPEDRTWVEQEMGEFESNLLQEQCFALEPAGFEVFEHTCAHKREEA